MPEQGECDTRFSLPAVDDPPSTEVGVILMGLDAERILAGLGLATLADDPALVTLVVDQVRHDAVEPITLDAVLAAGARRWRSARAALAETDRGTSMSAAPRQRWIRALGVVTAADIGAAGPATRAYLAACWLRRTEIERCAENR